VTQRPDGHQRLRHRRSILQRSVRPAVTRDAGIFSTDESLLASLVGKIMSSVCKWLRHRRSGFQR